MREREGYSELLLIEHRSELSLSMAFENDLFILFFFPLGSFCSPTLLGNYIRFTFSCVG